MIEFDSYRSKSVPVKAFRVIDIDNLGFIECFYDKKHSYEGMIVNENDWIVQFPNNEVHIVEDEHFKQRFERTEKFTKTELSYASKLAKESDCI